jgi:hypothetical protein
MMPNPSIVFWPLNHNFQLPTFIISTSQQPLGWLSYSLPAIKSQFPSFQHSSFLQVRAEEVVAMESDVTK